MLDPLARDPSSALWLKAKLDTKVTSMSLTAGIAFKAIRKQESATLSRILGWLWH